MKKILTYVFMLLAFVGFCVTGPMEARAEFAEKPVAYVVIDHSREVTGANYKDFRNVVKLIYHFPNYKLIDGGAAQEQLVDMVNARQKLDKMALAKVAQEQGMEGIVVARIYQMDERIIPRFNFRDDDTTLVRVTAYADLMVYRQEGDRFLMKKLRETEVREMGAYDKPDYTIKWALSRVINTLEGKEII